MIGNDWVAERLRELLEQDGYNVVVRSKAQQTLEILETNSPEVILAEAEGGDICRHRSLRDRKDVRAIAAHPRDPADPIRAAF